MRALNILYGQQKMLKLPKKLQISGMTYLVRADKTSYDGGGSTASIGIIVGTKSKNAEREWEILLHEVMEIAACERGYRYGSGTSKGSVFVMNHAEFDDYSKDIATAIRPLLK